MRHIIKVTVLNLTLIACTDSSNQDAASSTSQVHTVLQIDTTRNIAATSQKILINSDTLLIDKQAAIFVEPDSLRIEKEKKKGSEEDFYIGANDYIYYMGTAHEFLDSVKVTIISTENKKFIQFVGRDKKRQIINIDKLPELWSIYFFDPAKKAKQVDMTMIEEEYKTYFK